MKLRRLATVAAAAALFLGISVSTAAADPAAQSQVYVALGDSYSSGVGAGSYDSGSGSCKRSNNAYPRLWANANNPAAFHFTACSGAKTNDVINNQLGPLNSSTTLVSISIGGNDAGFADAMITCVLQGTSSCVNRVNQANAYIANQLPARLDAVYSQIRAKAPNARVVVLGYPRMYKLNGSCWVGISETSRAAINGAADNIHAVTSQRAAAHGFVYGDVRGTFAGHEICGNLTEWIHSVAWPLDNSYHPKKAGQSGGYYPVLRSLA
ncbi:SGNH family lipase [Streptomyces sodiiphilus]|uniref:SGNH family lipase n=1 Tax=Streptomyces sodiiphilus TaxID=226217 RepID=A0ABN2NY81_9ACTN